MGQKHLHLLLAFILMTTAQVRFRADGNVISRLLQVLEVKVGDEDKAILRARIGSRPPSCERRCHSCGPCEAVQMPAVPQDRNGRRHSSKVSAFSSRGEDTSNYKPMSWKCKCGDMIFNP